MNIPELRIELKKRNKITSATSAVLAILITVASFRNMYAHLGPYNDMGGLMFLMYFPFAIFSGVFVLNTLAYLAFILSYVIRSRAKYSNFNFVSGLLLLTTLLLCTILGYFYFGAYLIIASVVASFWLMLFSFSYAKIILKIGSTKPSTVLSICIVIVSALLIAGIYNNVQRSRGVRSLVVKYGGDQLIYHQTSVSDCKSTDIYTSSTDNFSETHNISLYKDGGITTPADIVGKNHNEYVQSVPTNMSGLDAQKYIERKAAEIKSNIVSTTMLESVDSIEVLKYSYFNYIDRSITSYIVIISPSSRCFFF